MQAIVGRTALEESVVPPPLLWTSDDSYGRGRLIRESAKYVWWMFYLNSPAPVLTALVWALVVLAVVWQSYWIPLAVGVHVGIWYSSYRTVKRDLPSPSPESIR